MNVTIKHAASGELKEIKIGWSWILFLFSGFFGIPLFMRQLTLWGGVFVGLGVFQLLLSGIDAAFAGLISFLLLGLSIYMGISGNEMTAKNYLQNGWEFADHDSARRIFRQAVFG